MNMMKETLSHFEKEMNLCSGTVTEMNKKNDITKERNSETKKKGGKLGNRNVNYNAERAEKIDNTEEQEIILVEVIKTLKQELKETQRNVLKINQSPFKVLDG